MKESSSTPSNRKPRESGGWFRLLFSKNGRHIASHDSTAYKEIQNVLSTKRSEMSYGVNGIKGVKFSSANPAAMYFCESWSDLFQIDKCEQYLDYSRHPFENLPFCMEEIKDGEILILTLLGVIEEECDEYFAKLSDSSTNKISEEISVNKEGMNSVIMVRHGKTSLTLGWKLPADFELIQKQLEKDWAVAKVDGEQEHEGALKHTYIDYGSSNTSLSTINILKTNGDWLSLEPDEVELEEKEGACFVEERGTGFYSNFFESRESFPYLVAAVAKTSKGLTVDELKGEGLPAFKEWIRSKLT